MINLYVPSITSYRPDRLETPPSKKNEKYHIDMANWTISNACQNEAYIEHMNRIEINKKFYINDQWCLDEDNIFLEDEPGDPNGRIRTKVNYVQAMGSIFKATASKMDFTARAKSFSPYVKTRKEDELARLIFYTNLAEDNPMLKDNIQKTMPVGKNEEETKQIFENIYRDKFVEACNNLLEYSEHLNKFDRLKSEIAETLFLSGMCITKPDVINGEYVFRKVMPERFYFDRTAKNYDGSDCNYMGEIDFMIPTDIYEKCPDMSDADKMKIEKQMRMMSDITYVTESSQIISGKVPVLKSYWRDGEKGKFGYVEDAFGQNVLRRLNYQLNDTDILYKESDCVPNSKLSPYERRVLKISKDNKTKNTEYLYIDMWRYCEYIPCVYTGLTKSAIPLNPDERLDIVLSYGVVPYGEKDLFSPSNMSTPYKMNFYIYIDGEVIAPCDIVIDPQRMVNRMYSVFENQVNHSGLSGAIINEMAFADPLAAAKSMKKGEPVFVNPQGMPVQNIVGTYNELPNRQASDLVKYAEVFTKIMEDTSNINNVMKGGANSEQLKGVMEMQLQRSMLVLEPFFNAIQFMYEDMYQAILTSGRRLYIDNKKQLVCIIGDETKVFELTEDMRWEDFKVKVVKSVDPEKERAMVDQLIISYMNPQVNLLDDTRAANLLHRGSMDDVAREVREYAKEKLQIKRQMAEAQQKQQAVQLQMLQQNKQEQLALMQREKQREDMNAERDRISQFDRDALKGHTKIEIEKLKKGMIQQEQQPQQ